ncbi:MAG: hypothetical protein AB1656_12280 [Candidatus Omnitrophota bacterium]
MTNNDAISITFEDILGSSTDNFSMEKLSSFLESVVENTFRQRDCNAAELIRVVQNGRIYWMTAAQADALLREKEETADSLKNSVQQSLRGDFRVIAQELKILFLLAQHTLNMYLKQHLIPAGEVQWATPHVTRLGRQIVFYMDKLWQVEEKMKKTRMENPVLREFETKMSEFLECQKTGDRENAMLLAKDLAVKKAQYVRISRGLASDVTESSHLRIDLQRQKKSILSFQKYLLAQRQGVLQSQVQDMRKTVENLKTLLARSEEESKKERCRKNLEERNAVLQRQEKELSALDKESAVLDKKEKETDQLISTMEAHLQVSDAAAKSKTESPPAEEKAPHMPDSLDNEESTSKTHRMITIERRHRR